MPIIKRDSKLVYLDNVLYEKFDTTGKITYSTKN